MQTVLIVDNIEIYSDKDSRQINSAGLSEGCI